MNTKSNIIDWGTIPYGEAYRKQTELFDLSVERKRNHEPTSNHFVFCEHPHVITVGKNGLASNLLFPEAVLQEKDVEFFRTDRGGDVTYHGPGQIVGYPIIDLEAYHIGLKEYIHRLEEIIIQTIAYYGIKGERLEGAAGVWLEHDRPTARKIAAIGVRCSRFITMHGFALNVNTDLDYYRLINPCGFVDKGVTSLEKELGHTVDVQEVKTKLIESFGGILYQ